MTEIDFPALRREEAEHAAQRARLRVALLDNGWVVEAMGMGHILVPEAVAAERYDDLPRTPETTHIVLNHTGEVKLSRFNAAGTVSEQTYEGNLDIPAILAMAAAAADWVAEHRAAMLRDLRAEQVAETVEFFEATGIKVTPEDLLAITSLRDVMDVVRDAGHRPMAVLAPPGWLGVEQGAVIYGLAIWQHETYRVPCLAIGLHRGT